MLQGVNTYIGIFADTFKYFNRGKAWLWLLVIFVVEGLILQAHYKFYSPMFYWLMSPWINLDQQTATGFIHYPGHFLLLPLYFGKAKFIIGSLFEGAILGAVALIFYRHSTGSTDTIRHSGGQMFMRWFQLCLAWFIINGLFYLVNLFLPQMFNWFLENHPRRIIVFNTVCLPFVFVLIMSIFYFIIPYIAIYRVNVFKAIKNSFILFIRNPFICFFSALTILLIPIILSILLSNQTTIVDKFNPELVYYLLLLGLFIDILVNFFWVGTAVRYLIEKE
jgi:hypothetical protein